MNLAEIRNLVEVKRTLLAVEYIDEEGVTDWIPDNETQYRSVDPDGLISIHIPLWLAKKKKFDYEEID